LSKFLEVNCNALSRYSVDNVSVTYNGKVALHGANLLLVSGSIGGLVGMNGSGKSTLFKSIMGFVKPTTGRVLTDQIGAKREHGGLRSSIRGSGLEFPVSVWDVVMMSLRVYECTKDSQSN